MRSLSGILPAPTTQAEDWSRTMNRLQAELIPNLSIAKKIYVYYTDECIFCGKRESAICEACGEKADGAWKQR